MIASVIPGYDFSPYATIVDVGGGQGRMLAAILGARPHSRGILFDLPHVVAGAPPYSRNMVSVTESELPRGRSSMPYLTAETPTFLNS